MFSGHQSGWLILTVYVALLLAIDLLVLHKKNQVPSFKRSMFETIFFVVNAFIFAGIVYWIYDQSYVSNPLNHTPEKSVMDYVSGYLIELSLSVDNLFVIAVIFKTYKVEARYQHRLLFLGILGAVIFRGILIFIGIALINEIHELVIVFGAFLLYSAFKMLKNDESESEGVKRNWLMKILRFSDEPHKGKLVIRSNGKLYMTTLFAALITIEITDVLFAFDSIPAIFSVSTDTFIVFSSNIFAILGLRSLYYFLSNMLDRFKLLKYSVFAILVFVSIKLMTSTFLEIPDWFSLLFIFISLALGVIVSIQITRKK